MIVGLQALKSGVVVLQLISFFVWVLGVYWKFEIGYSDDIRKMDVFNLWETRHMNDLV